MMGGGEGVFSLVEYSRLHIAVTVNTRDNSRNAPPNDRSCPVINIPYQHYERLRGEGRRGEGVVGRENAGAVVFFHQEPNCILSPKDKLWGLKCLGIQ